MILFLKFYIFVIICGLHCCFTGAREAPGHITMVFTYKHQTIDKARITLDSNILQNDSKTEKTIYEGADSFKQKSLQSDLYELSITFYTENIKLPIVFIAKLTIIKIYDKHSMKEFKDKFSFLKKSLKYINNELAMSKTFYSKKMDDELDVIVTSRCKPNYYPDNVCDVKCEKTKNTKECDENGNKVCHQGYYFNKETSLCDNDWCWQHQSECLNGGTCHNLQNRLHCNCSLSYKGTFCEEYYDACQNFVCPNGTKCTVKDKQFHCKRIEKLLKTSHAIKSEVLSISFTTLIVIASAIVLFAVSLCVTFWACKKPKYHEYRPSDESMNYKGHSYYNFMDTKSHPHSIEFRAPEHLQCDCKRGDWGNDNFYSLKLPSNRPIYRSNRPNSDLMLSRSNGRISRTPSIHTTTSNSVLDCEYLPLPPSIEVDGTFHL